MKDFLISTFDTFFTLFFALPFVITVPIIVLIYFLFPTLLFINTFLILLTIGLCIIHYSIAIYAITYGLLDKNAKLINRGLYILLGMVLPCVVSVILLAHFGLFILAF